MIDYEIQENFLKKVAQMYTTFSADPIVDELAARFHYSSMWVCDEIKSRTAYLYYITRKLEAMKNSGVRFNFVMMYKQGDGKPVLMFSPKTPDGGYQKGKHKEQVKTMKGTLENVQKTKTIRDNVVDIDRIRRLHDKYKR